MPEELIIHPKLQQFSQYMQQELDANSSAKGNWEEFLDITNIFLELEWHKAKLLFAMRDGDQARIREYLADCANNLLFLANALEVV